MIFITYPILRNIIAELILGMWVSLIQFGEENESKD